MNKFEELEFGPSLWPDGFNLIPRYLFEQIEGIKIDLDTLYKIGPGCISAGAVVYPITDGEHKIKGMLWVEGNFIEDVICVRFLSIDPEYQNGKAIEKTVEFLKAKGKTIQWATDRPEVFERKGFKRAEQVLMEI